MKRGYMTVYLSLTLGVLFSLILALVEGARINATRMRALCAADTSINSVLSEFNRELFEQYDLLFVDTTYCGGAGGIEAVRARLTHYLTENLDNSTPALSRDLLGMRLQRADILEYALATDNEAEAVRRQVADYMDTTLKGVLISGVDELTSGFGVGGFDYDTESERMGVQGQIDSTELPVVENEDGELEEVPLNNPADNVNSIRNAGILGMVLDDTSEISRTKVELEEYLSHRTLASGMGISEEERSLGRCAGELTYDEYIFDKYGFYGHLKEGSLLSYEIEYVIKGKDNDWDNLEAVCRTLALWREGANYCYLLTDASKMEEDRALALTLAAVLMNPELEEPVTHAILLAWAYVEALQDIKILLEGGGVPIIKTPETWHTDITCLFHPKSALRSYPGQEGPKYDSYLKTMLVLTSFSKVLPRSLDVMEMDVRLTLGNAAFKMDYCMQSFLVDIVTGSTHGHNAEIIRRSGYYYA